jgi:hypothetical protein
MMISFGSSRNVQGKKLVCVLAAMTIVLIGLRRGNGYAVLRRGSSSTVEDEEEAEGQSVMDLAPVLVEGRHGVVPMRHTFLRGGDDTIMSEELFAPSIYGMMFTKELVESRAMVLASEEEEGEEEGGEEEGSKVGEDSAPIPQDLP